mmetsp:Transcript_4012/g.7747  ORF Transcript_4012/g.7747 Transcript_4012/m.7747 type:complete len:239 (+) Transcript_4012:296-1012(+)
MLTTHALAATLLRRSARPRPRHPRTCGWRLLGLVAADPAEDQGLPSPSLAALQQLLPGDGRPLVLGSQLPAQGTPSSNSHLGHTCLSSRACHLLGLQGRTFRRAPGRRRRCVGRPCSRTRRWQLLFSLLHRHRCRSLQRRQRQLLLQAVVVQGSTLRCQQPLLYCCLAAAVAREWQLAPQPLLCRRRLASFRRRLSGLSLLSPSLPPPPSSTRREWRWPLQEGPASLTRWVFRGFRHR